MEEGLRLLPGHGEDEVAGRCAAGGSHRLDLVERQRAGGRADVVERERLERACRLVQRDGDKAARAVALGEFDQFVRLPSGDAGEAGSGEALDHAAARDDAGEDLELAAGDDGGEVGKLQSEAYVRLVAAEARHGLLVGEVGYGEGHALVRADGLDEGGVEARHEGDDIVGVHERHLEVELRELGEAVGAGVFVAEAAGYLEVAVRAGDHQELLQLLWGLREGVEAALVDAAGDEIVPRALGCALDEDGGFDLDEIALVEVVAYELDGAVAHTEVLAHEGPPQVQVAVAHAEQFVDRRVLAHVERRRLCRVEDDGGARKHLDVAGVEVGVGGALGTRSHRAGYLRHPLGAEPLRDVKRVRRLLRVEDDLHEAGAVAQVDENEPAVVAPPVHPPGQRDGLSCVFEA